MRGYKKLKRGLWLVAIMTCLWGFSAFTISHFKDSLEYYYSPAEILTKPHLLMAKKPIRLGGLIEMGSVHFHNSPDFVEFVLQDGKHSIKVYYRSHALPPLFKENSGAIARGNLVDSENFEAFELIAKHDEKYAPPGKSS